MSLNRTDVVVVGAGLAGLSAARALRRAGLRVAVLEARERTGGRVHSVDLFGVGVDLGGQWIGPGQDRMYALAREAGAALVTTHAEGQSLYRLNGPLRRGSDVPPVGPLALLDAHRVQHQLDQAARSVDPARPGATPSARALDAVSFRAWLRSSAWTHGARSLWAAVIEAGACAAASEVSALAVAVQLRTMGGTGPLETAEREFFAGGAGRVVERLAEAVSDSVRLGQPVRRIERSDAGVHVHTGAEVWRAEAVVVAVPPALAGRISYDPPLPALRDGLTQRVGQGAVIKCLLVYDEPFWRRDGLSGALLSAEGPVTAALDGTPEEGPGVLVALSTGPYARTFGSERPEARREAVVTALATAFGPPARHPLAYRDHDWSADEWSRGGYGAIPAPGVLSQFGPALSAPVGRIFWAGTETASAWRNYMEGAVESGERAAIEVRELLSESNDVSALAV